MIKRWWLSAFGAIGLIWLDRWTKLFFVMHPSYQANLPGMILEYRLNQAMALSLPLIPALYYTLTFVVIIIVVYLMMQAVLKAKLAEFTITLAILVGAFSNLFDRFLYGGVVDFIAIPIGSVLNLADCYIVIAIIIWCVIMLQHDKRDDKPANQKISTTH